MYLKVKCLPGNIVDIYRNPAFPSRHSIMGVTGGGDSFLTFEINPKCLLVSPMGISLKER